MIISSFVYILTIKNLTKCEGRHIFRNIFCKFIQQLGGVMKNLLFILLLGLGFSQTELTTRVYTIENISIMSGVNYEIDINQILGFEFCLNAGANLVSYPCDNPVPVGDALPNGIENFVTDIIGEGQATTYSSSLGWIGSLSSFNEGGGYWFKSNSDVCFEYDCVAN